MYYLHQKGVKDDEEKLDYYLLLSSFSDALTHVTDVAHYGAEKYTRDGWKTVPNAFERYFAALLRHIWAHVNGESRDEESGRYHLAHAAWNALAILQLYITTDEEDVNGTGS